MPLVTQASQIEWSQSAANAWNFNWIKHGRMEMWTPKRDSGTAPYIQLNAIWTDINYFAPLCHQSIVFTQWNALPPYFFDSIALAIKKRGLAEWKPNRYISGILTLHLPVAFSIRNGIKTHTQSHTHTFMHMHNIWKELQPSRSIWIEERGDSIYLYICLYEWRDKSI